MRISHIQKRYGIPFFVAVLLGFAVFAVYSGIRVGEVVQAQTGISYVQSTNATGSGSSVAESFISNTTAGNLIVVVVTWVSTSATASVSDSQGNSYAVAVGPVVGTRSTSQIFYAENIAGGPNTITATFSGSQNSQIGIHEYAGLALSGALDVTSSNTGSSTLCDSGALTTTQSDALIFGSCSAETNPGTRTAGALFTERENATKILTEDRIVSTTGSYSADVSFTNFINWIGIVAAFRAEAPAGNVVPSVVTVADSPDPVVEGSEVAFTVDWSDGDTGEQVQVHICKTNSLTSQACSGGSWVSSGGFAATNPIVVNYTTTAGDVGAQDYFAFVCDDEAACSSGTAGTFTVDSVANVSPTAHASATPESGNAPLAVAFSSAGSTDPDGTIVEYSWDYGDGTAAQVAENPSHTYTTSGTYTAVLTVTDDGGATATSQVIVTVSSAGAPDVVLTKSVDATEVTEGDTFTYTIEYVNNGSVRAVQVFLTDSIPLGTTYVAGSATNGGIYNTGAGQVEWTIPQLEVGASGSVSFQVQT